MATRMHLKQWSNSAIHAICKNYLASSHQACFCGCRVLGRWTSSGSQVDVSFGDHRIVSCYGHRVTGYRMTLPVGIYHSWTGNSCNFEDAESRDCKHRVPEVVSRIGYVKVLTSTALQSKLVGLVWRISRVSEHTPPCTIACEGMLCGLKSTPKKAFIIRNVKRYSVRSCSRLGFSNHVGSLRQVRCGANAWIDLTECPISTLATGALPDS